MTLQDSTVNEVTFLVEEAPEGGYSARALGASIFTEAEDLDNLHVQIRDAVTCHFEETVPIVCCISSRGVDFGSSQ